jgi:hypothetical protein
MKAYVRRGFLDLPKREQEAIKQELTEQYYGRLDEELKQTQVTWIKLQCYVLDKAGLTEEQILWAIVEWKRAYAKNRRFKTNEARDKWLDGEMKRIFKTCGFPDVRIQEMKDM